MSPLKKMMPSSYVSVMATSSSRMLAGCSPEEALAAFNLGVIALGAAQVRARSEVEVLVERGRADRGRPEGGNRSVCQELCIGCRLQGDR